MTIVEKTDAWVKKASESLPKSGKLTITGVCLAFPQRMLDTNGNPKKNKKGVPYNPFFCVTLTDTNKAEYQLPLNSLSDTYISQDKTTIIPRYRGEIVDALSAWYNSHFGTFDELKEAFKPFLNKEVSVETIQTVCSYRLKTGTFAATTWILN